jgi:hypothetical protein
MLKSIKTDPLARGSEANERALPGAWALPGRDTNEVSLPRDYQFAILEKCAAKR